MLAETAYEDKTHWLLFLFEVKRPILHSEITDMEIDEGVLEWAHVDDVENKDIPETDRQIIWNLVKQHRGGFFAVHIDCSVKPFSWTVQEEWTATDV